jgi:hypothetical protein
MSETPSYYSVTPANVRYDENLTMGARFLYGEITALCNKKGYCWARNAYFAELYKVSNRTISEWIKQLIDNGYILCTYRYREGTKEIEARYLSIAQVTPDFNTCGKNLHGGVEENFYTPMEENFRDNITDINTTTNNDDSVGGNIQEDSLKSTASIQSFPLSKATALYKQHAPSLYKREFDRGLNDDYKNAQALMQAIDEGFDELQAIELYKRAERSIFIRDKLKNSTLKWFIEKRDYIMAGKYDDLDNPSPHKADSGDRHHIDVSEIKDW